MATTNTISRLSSGKTSKKKIASTIPADNTSTLTNLMLTAELLAGPQVHPTTESTTTPDTDATPTSLWMGIRNSPQFSSLVISLICAFFVSAAFYCAAKTMMKTKFEDMFSEKLPRYKNLVYGIGSVQNIDVDHVLLRDDLNDQYFVLDEGNGSITINVQEIFEQYKQESKETLVKQPKKNTIIPFQDDQTEAVRISLSQSKKESSV
jgi:hypothetical protein